MLVAIPYDVADADFLLDRFDPTRGFDWQARHIFPAPLGHIFRVPDSDEDWTIPPPPPCGSKTVVQFDRRGAAGLATALELAATPSWRRVTVEAWLLAQASDDGTAAETSRCPNVIAA